MGFVFRGLGGVFGVFCLFVFKDELLEWLRMTEYIITDCELLEQHKKSQQTFTELATAVKASGIDHQTPENKELNTNILTIFSFELF